MARIISTSSDSKKRKKLLERIWSLSRKQISSFWSGVELVFSEECTCTSVWRRINIERTVTYIAEFYRRSTSYSDRWCSRNYCLERIFTVCDSESNMFNVCYLATLTSLIITTCGGGLLKKVSNASVVVVLGATTIPSHDFPRPCIIINFNRNQPSVGASD